MRVLMTLVLVDVLSKVTNGVEWGLKDLEIRGQAETIQITLFGRNEDKSPGDLRRLGITQTPVRNH